MMKWGLILAFVCTATEMSYGAWSALPGPRSRDAVEDTSAVPDSSVPGPSRPDSAAARFSMVAVPGYFPLSISVTPDSAADAMIAVEKRSNITIEPNVTTTFWIPPEPVGTWGAPVTMYLPAGNYSVVAAKPGFRTASRLAMVADPRPQALIMSMVSLRDLDLVRSRWRTYKWASGAVAAGAGIATLYFQTRVSRFQIAYDNDVSPAAATANRNHVSTNQSLFHVSSAIALSAAAACLVSWLLESLSAN